MYQVLTLLTPFITMPYISRVLLPEAIGVQSFAFAVSLYFAIFASMGINIYGQREISYYQDNRKELTRIFWELKVLSLITTAIWLVIYLTLVKIYVRNNHILYYILTINLFGVVIDVVWFFQGLEEFGKVVARNVVVKIIDVAFIFLFIKKPSDLALHVFGSVFFSVFGNLTLWIELPKYIDWPDWKNLNPFRDIQVIISLFIPTIAIQVYTILDKLMLGFFTEGSFENGYYELAMRISRMALMVVSSLGTVVVPRIAYLFKKNEREIINEYIYRSFKFIWFISVPMCLGLIAISDNFVAWFFGDFFTKVAGLLKISSVMFIAMGLNGVTGGQYLIPTGRQNLFTFTILIGASVNFIMNIFFIRLFQSYGALFASVTAEFLIAFMQIYILRKEISLKKIILCGKNYIIAGLVMFFILMSINKYFAPSMLNTLILIFAGAVIYFTVLFIFRDEFFINNIKRVWGVFSRFQKKK